MLKSIVRNGETVHCSECGTAVRARTFILYVEQGTEWALHSACFRRLFKTGTFDQESAS